MRTLLITAVLAGLIMAGCGKKVTHTTGSPVTDERCLEIVAPKTGTFTDSRDGQTYRTVKADGQIWMAENMNYRTDSGSWCYDDKESNCGRGLGRLYNRKTAKTVCPAGWKLPDTTDCRMFVTMPDEEEIACIERWKSERRQDWSDASIVIDNGMDDYGYLTAPGYRDPSGIFINASAASYWWMATEGSDGDAYSWILYRGGSVWFGKYYDNKDFGFSVRCVADTP